jgi:hypothetical protein
MTENLILFFSKKDWRNSRLSVNKNKNFATILWQLFEYDITWRCHDISRPACGWFSPKVKVPIF